MNRVRGIFAAISAALLLGVIAPARAGVVEDWNALSVACITRAGPTAFLDYALVQVAVHDAVQSKERRFEKYAVKVNPVGGETLAGLVAGAAWGVLVDTRVCPLGAARDNALAAFTTASAADAAGTALGYSVGQQMVLTEYRTIPVPAPVYTPVPGLGEWQPTAPGNGAFAFVYLATTQPYVLWKPWQFRPPPPPSVNSWRYKRELQEVIDRGGQSSHPATADCTSSDPAQSTADLARFWSGNYGVLWNQATRDLSIARGLSIGDAARLLALVNLAVADGTIAVWDSKLKYHFWRPETAIAAGGNTTWAPFIRGPSAHFPQTPVSQTPAYPDYVSGANGITGAATGMLRLYFGRDRMNFSINKAVPGVVPICTNPRTFRSFSDAAEEVVDGRILLGIHFRSADEVARYMGEGVALWTFFKALRPVPKKGWGHHDYWDHDKD